MSGERSKLSSVHSQSDSVSGDALSGQGQGQGQETQLKVLIVEDDKALQTAIADSLELEKIDVVCADSAEEALKILKSESVHMLISDINMPKMSGEDLLLQVRQDYPYLPVMLMTAYSSVDRAVKAIQRGAVDYLAKPFSLAQLTAKVKQYSKSMAATHDNLPIMASRESQSVFAMAARVAESNANVLITGESGTGKEVLARYIHDQSSRSSKNFVAINCAAIPENMLEAILFGHEKGSFTGAHKAMPGKFELADGGTLLLDEITEMPLVLQAKILRVLQEREVERIGGKQPISIDVRVIATTNKDIAQEVRNQNFREDLFYRVNVFPLQWQPLRERQDDILPLADYFLSRHVGSKVVKPILSECAEQKLLAYSWPGNVRELDNVIQRALVLSRGDIISAEDFFIQYEVPAPKLATPKGLTLVESGVALTEVDAKNHLLSGEDVGEDLRSQELKSIIDCLRKYNGNRKKTAEALGVSARTLRYKIAKIKELWPAMTDI